MTCGRCGGPMYLDTAFGVPVVTKAWACWRGCSRVEVDDNLVPLAVVGSLSSIEERILLARAQGLTGPMIARRLCSSRELITLVLQQKDDQTNRKIAGGASRVQERIG